MRKSSTNNQVHHIQSRLNPPFSFLPVLTLNFSQFAFIHVPGCIDLLPEWLFELTSRWTLDLNEVAGESTQARKGQI